jgi:hypothetical protein
MKSKSTTFLKMMVAMRRKGNVSFVFLENINSQAVGYFGLQKHLALIGLYGTFYTQIFDATKERSVL